MILDNYICLINGKSINNLQVWCSFYSGEGNGIQTIPLVFWAASLCYNILHPIHKFAAPLIVRIFFKFQILLHSHKHTRYPIEYNRNNSYMEYSQNCLLLISITHRSSKHCFQELKYIPYSFPPLIWLISIILLFWIQWSDFLFPFAYSQKDTDGYFCCCFNPVLSWRFQMCYFLKKKKKQQQFSINGTYL